MHNDLTRDDFAGCLDTFFRVLDNPAAPFDLTLTHVSELHVTARQRDYSLLFHGAPDRYLPQQIYPVEHPQLGQFDLFLVPIEQDATGFVYQAVFNQLIRPQ